MKLREDIAMHEDAHEFAREDKIVRLWSEFPMEKQMMETYALPIYNRFQVVLQKITSYNARDYRGGGVFEIFPVIRSILGYGRRTYKVDVDYDNEIYNYECCKFDKDGILYCHVLKVMSYIGAVRKILECYILPRWSHLTPNIIIPPTELPQKSTEKLPRKDMRMLWYGNMCSEFSKLAVGLAALEKTKEIAEKHLKAMERELAGLKRVAAEALKRNKKENASSSYGPITNESPSIDVEQEALLAENRKARAPPVTNTKGMPGSKRKRVGYNYGSLSLQHVVYVLN
jgi:hypothetical protein